MAALAEQARIDAIPERTFSGRGGVYLPPYLWSWLMKPSEESTSVVDIGVLAAVLFALEHGQAPFFKSEIVDGEIVLDPGAGCQLLPALNPHAELSELQVRDAINYFAGDNGWFEVTTVEARTRIGRGGRARKLLEEATAP